MQQMDPSGNPTVAPLHVITPAMGNTKLAAPLWYVCTIPNASMHRNDGKKLPFVSGFFKCFFQEDARYLNNEIESGNMYIRQANAKEIEAARMLEDPLGMIKDNLRVEVEQNVRDSLTLEDLEKLVAERRKQAETKTNVVTPNQPPAKPETAAEKAARMLLEIQASKAAGGSGLNAATTDNIPGAKSTSSA
jgi:hypothetical protein